MSHLISIGLSNHNGIILELQMLLLQSEHITLLANLSRTVIPDVSLLEYLLSFSNSYSSFSIVEGSSLDTNIGE